MLSCKQLSRRASECLEQSPDTPLSWQIRLHLLLCRHCRRFVRHLRITRTVAARCAGAPPLDEKQCQHLLTRIKARRQ